MRVSIGSDHAGFEQKQALVDYLVGKGYDVIDRGPDNDDRVDYPDYAAPVAHDVADGVAERGVLVCGTGIGMAMAADKVPGVRAANIINPEFAALCREHNDANVIAIGARQHTFDEITTFIDAFIATPFSGDERHVRRIAQVGAYELDGSLEPDPRAVIGGESVDEIDPEAG